MFSSLVYSCSRIYQARFHNLIGRTVAIPFGFLNGGIPQVKAHIWDDKPLFFPAPAAGCFTPHESPKFLTVYAEILPFCHTAR